MPSWGVRKGPLIAVLAVTALAAALVGLVVWAGNWGGLRHIWFFVLLGVSGVGITTGLFMWLAFFSARRGYDEPAEFEPKDGSEPP